MGVREMKCLLGFIIFAILLASLVYMDGILVEKWHAYRENEPELIAKIDNLFVYEMPDGTVTAKLLTLDE